VAQGVGPEFKLQHHEKNKNKTWLWPIAPNQMIKVTINETNQHHLFSTWCTKDSSLHWPTCQKCKIWILTMRRTNPYWRTVYKINGLHSAKLSMHEKQRFRNDSD
jgi:hypothetical protein